jgi:hypothetical protein
VLVLGIFAAGYGLASQRHDRQANDQAAMRGRAAQVMPFDLSATTHTFTKTDRGGVQQVLANDPADGRNIGLIRSHLQQEAAAFRTGDYSDPARIHGMDMPGVKELQAGASRVEVRYQPLPAGARITYSSSDPVLVAALHAWFDRQTSDHAMPGMGG